MRVLHICLDYPPRRTQYGSGAVTDDLLSAQSRAGYEVVVLTPGRADRQAGLVDANGVGLIQAPTELTSRYLVPPNRPNEMFATPADVAEWNLAVAGWFRAKRPLGTWTPDVVHNDGWTTQLVADAVAETYDCPVITTAHVIDRHYRSVPGRRPQAIDHEFQRAEQHSFAASDLIVVPSRTAADLVQHYFPVSASKVRVVAHGLDWAAVDATAKTAPIIPTTAIRVVYLGRISSERGWEPFLEAFTTAAEREPRLALRVIGDGPGLPRARQQWSHPNISFAGGLPRHDVLRELATADIFCNPALIETFGVAEAEALGLGACVISGSGFGKHTHVEHRVTGVQIPLEWTANRPTFTVAAWSSWLGYLAADGPLRRQLAEQGRHRARQMFGISRMVDDLGHVYSEAGGYDLPHINRPAHRRPT